jgi:hypothetical protein
MLHRTVTVWASFRDAVNKETSIDVGRKAEHSLTIATHLKMDAKAETYTAVTYYKRV